MKIRGFFTILDILTALATQYNDACLHLKSGNFLWTVMTDGQTNFLPFAHADRENIVLCCAHIA